MTTSESTETLHSSCFTTSVDRTLILFASDHGDNLGSHGRFNKQLLIEESIRIPFIVWAPSLIEPARNRNQVAQIIDVMPTLLNFCGLAIPESVQGRSLMPVLKSECSILPGENVAYIETSAGFIGIRSSIPQLSGSRVIS